MGPILKHTITLVVMQRATGGVISDFDLAAIDREIDQGTWIGKWVVTDTEIVPPEKVEEELKALDNDGSFFKGM